VLGWLAKSKPEIVRMITQSGHEIGLHSFGHQIITGLNKRQFREDILKNIDILESLTGKKINIYRAPGFSLNRSNPWVIETLQESGITIDSSIATRKLAHGGFPGFPQQTPCIISYNGIQLKEFPINSMRFAGLNLIFSGGGYFRFWPYATIRRESLNSNYIMSYFHPHDFDIERPVMKNLNMFRKFRSYYGLGSSLGKLEKWLDEFPFSDIRSMDAVIDWTKAPLVDLSV
jgi:polysaccharide deacetylase family protein (PEP-CTERM system associated)